ncbi:glutamate--tRNA ligase [Candidatus Karelsulcia muelleri]
MIKRPKIRVRFAPSPTGPLHIGNLRTALFNYLFAKKNKGYFIIRFEDTDQERYLNESEQHILNSLQWCGIKPDEGPDHGHYGPYRQSQRKHIYKPYIKYLLNNNYAYYAFESKDELKTIRKEYKDKGKLFIYNASTRNKLKNSFNHCYSQPLLKTKTKYTIRLNVPASKTIQCYDILRGNISINSKYLDDKVLVKSDGNVTYHLANVIDDHMMKITHVIKGEEWISSFPILHVLYDYLNWKRPQFIHLPLILNSFGPGKLSKRNKNKFTMPIFPLKWKYPLQLKYILGYRELGYFPEALLNMLAFFGWNPGGEKEMFSLKELIATFSLKDLNLASARFDKNKMDWMNHIHLQSKSIDELTRLVKLCLKEKQIDCHNDHKIPTIILRIRSQCTFVYQIIEQAIYCFKKPHLKKKDLQQQIINIKRTKKILFVIIEWFNNYDKKKLKFLRLFVSQLAFNKNIHIHYLLKLLRISLVGKLVGLELWFIINILTTKDIIHRIWNFILLFQ